MTSRDSLEPKFCYETLQLLIHRLSEKVEHLLKGRHINGGQGSWNDLASVKWLEMEMDSISPLF